MSKALPILGQMFDRTPARFLELRERARERAIPFHAQVYLVNACNLKCEHCYEDESTHATDEMMSLSEVEGVLTDLAALGCLQLTLTGGEIFLRRDIFEILAVAKRLRFHTTLFTSGTLLNREKILRLKELGVAQVDISVYSDVAADHDAFTRIPGSWKRSTDALRMLAEHGVKAALKCVLTTFSVDRIDDIVRLAHELGVAFQLDPNVRPRMSNDRSTLKYALDAKTLADKVFARRDLYPGFREVTPDTICHGADFLHGSSAMCGAGSSTLAVAASGDVLPCGFFPTAVGNVRNNALRDIWERNAVLHEMRGMTFEKMTSCPSCSVRSACHPCMAYGQVEHGDFRACNTASQTSAEALVRLAERAERTNAKIGRGGRPLSIVGDTTLPEAEGTAGNVLAMFD